MKNIGKNVRALCCLVLSLTTLLTTACVSLSPSGMTPPTSQSYGNQYGNNGGSGNQTTPDGEEDESQDEEENGNENDGGESGGVSEFTPLDPSEPELPELKEPDENKTVSTTEIDKLGHKIVTYTDGTWDDLGRAEALDLSAPDPTEQYGYQYFGKESNGAGMQDLYTALHTTATQFHGSANALETTGTGTSKTCRLASYKLSDYGVTQSEAEAVWRIFAMENPAFFWIDDQLASSSEKLVFLVNEEYANASARVKAQTAIAEMALDCDQYINGKMSEEVLATTVHDYLAGRIEYAYQSDGVTPETELWAHSIVGAATENAGVCETYAKTYDYLCTLFGLDCLTVAGKGVTNGSAVGHAWNVVKLENEWFDVDVTWDDLGDEEISRAWLGKNSSEFSETHIARVPSDGWNLNYQYELPARCDRSLNLVSYGVYASGNYTLAGSVQSAFNEMTGESKKYVVYLYPHTNASKAMGLTVENRGGAEKVTFPQVTTVLFCGSYTEYADGSYTLSEFTLTGDNVLPCHLGVQDVQLSGGSLDTSGRIVLTKGTMAKIDMPIQRSAEAENAVWVQTEKATLLYGFVDIYSLVLSSGELRLCGGGEIQEASVEGGSTLCCYSAEDVTFESLYLKSVNDRLYIDKASSSTKITVNALSGNGTYGMIAVNYNSAAEYPTIEVGSISSSSFKIYLGLYGTVSPAALEKVCTLGTDEAFANLKIYYLTGNSLTAQTMSKYARSADGSVAYVG